MYDQQSLLCSNTKREKYPKLFRLIQSVAKLLFWSLSPYFTKHTILIKSCVVFFYMRIAATNSLCSRYRLCNWQMSSLQLAKIYKRFSLLRKRLRRRSFPGVLATSLVLSSRRGKLASPPQRVGINFFILICLLFNWNAKSVIERTLTFVLIAMLNRDSKNGIEEDRQAAMLHPLQLFDAPTTITKNYLRENFQINASLYRKKHYAITSDIDFQQFFFLLCQNFRTIYGVRNRLGTELSYHTLILHPKKFRYKQLTYVQTVVDGN